MPSLLLYSIGHTHTLTLLERTAQGCECQDKGTIEGHLYLFLVPSLHHCSFFSTFNDRVKSTNSFLCLPYLLVQLRSFQGCSPRPVLPLHIHPLPLESWGSSSIGVQVRMVLPGDSFKPKDAAAWASEHTCPPEGPAGSSRKRELF